MKLEPRDSRDVGSKSWNVGKGEKDNRRLKKKKG